MNVLSSKTRITNIASIILILLCKVFQSKHPPCRVVCLRGASTPALPQFHSPKRYPPYLLFHRCHLTRGLIITLPACFTWHTFFFRKKNRQNLINAWLTSVKLYQLSFTACFRGVLALGCTCNDNRWMLRSWDNYLVNAMSWASYFFSCDRQINAIDKLATWQPCDSKKLAGNFLRLFADYGNYTLSV